MNHSTEGREAAADVFESELDLPLSALLKRETSDIHDVIEHGSEINRRIVIKLGLDKAQEETREAYRETYRMFLLAAFGFERSVIDRIERFAVDGDMNAVGYIAEAAKSTDLILADLSFLNDGEAMSDLPRMPGLPEIGSLAELAGMEYVRRGSRNGNAYIARVVQHNLGCQAGSGASFLNLDNGLVHPHWQQFKEWLDSLKLSTDELLSAAATAITTFHAVGEWHRQFEL